MIELLAFLGLLIMFLAIVVGMLAFLSWWFGDWEGKKS